MTTESRAWRLAKLAAQLEEATKRLKLAVMTGNWRDARIYAEKAVEAEEAIAEVERQPLAQGTAS